MLLDSCAVIFIPEKGVVLRNTAWQTIGALFVNSKLSFREFGARKAKLPGIEGIRPWSQS